MSVNFLKNMVKLTNYLKLNLKKIKLNFLKKKNMSYDFINFKVKELEDKINLKETATNDGKNNLPRSSSETFSNCENEAIINADEVRNNQVSKAVDYLNSIKEKLIDSTANLGQNHFYIDELKNKVQRTLTAAEGKLSNLKDSYIIQNKEVRNFKLENNLNRDPQSLSIVNVIVGIFVIAILFIIELQVNANLLAPAMTSGKREGLSIAGAVAGLNVFVSFAVGYYALKNFHHVQKVRKYISKFCLTLYLLFISYLNWSLGAYRAIHETDNVNLMDLMMGNTETTSMITGNPNLPWTVDLTFTSFILIFVGIGFALASLIDGYLFDDPYPGYGSVGKNRNENKKEINRIREHISTEVSSLINEETRKAGEIRDKLINNTLRKDWIPSITALDNTFEGYRRFSQQISEALDHTIGEYRSINSMYRTDEEPNYWKDSDGKTLKEFYKLSEEKLDPNKVFKDFEKLYLNKEEIEKKIEFYQNQIQNESNEYINSINKFNDEVNLTIENVRSKYDVSQI